MDKIAALRALPTCSASAGACFSSASSSLPLAAFQSLSGTCWGSAQRLDVDRPIQRGLDYLDSKWPAITPRQLASHTAGIPHYQQVDEGRGGRRFGSVRESIGVFNGRDLLLAPGADYSYSSYGFTLLSAVVEQSAGKLYLDYLAAEIVPGLTIVPDPTDQGNPDNSRAYTYDTGALAPATPHDYSYSWGGAGLGATAGDLARFGGRMLSGEVVSNATLEWMLEPSRSANGAIAMNGGFPVGFGLRGGTDPDGERIAQAQPARSSPRSFHIPPGHRFGTFGKMVEAWQGLDAHGGCGGVRHEVHAFSGPAHPCHQEVRAWQLADWLQDHYAQRLALCHRRWSSQAQPNDYALRKAEKLSSSTRPTQQADSDRRPGRGGLDPERNGVNSTKPRHYR